MKNIKRYMINKVKDIYSIIPTPHSPLPTPHSTFPAPSIPIIVCLVPLIIFLISCQTTPNIPDARLENAANAPLSGGASVYLFADVNKARSVIEMLPINELRDSRVRQMLDRTDYIAAALFPVNTGRRFQLTAWGRYPSAVNLAFSSDKNWVKYNDSKWGAYWHSSLDKLSLAVSARNAFASGWINNSPESPFAPQPGVEIPEGFNEFRKEKKDSSARILFPRAPLACWVDAPGPAVVRILNEAGIPIRVPIQKIFIGLYDGHHSETRYTARILFQFENASQARATLSIINLASGFLSGVPEFISSVFFSNTVTQNGRNLEFVTSPLSRESLINILNLFMIFN